MRITVFGATGDVGRRVVNEALARGHEVTGVARDPVRLRELPAAVHARAGDAASVDDVVTLSDGQDMVISATRPARGDEGEHVAIVEALLAGLARTSVRLLLVGGAASLIVPGTGGATVIEDPDYPAEWRDIGLASNAQLEACLAEPEVDWAYLSPAALLEPGERTGRFRLGSDELLIDANGNSTISMEDLAVALLDEAEQPSRHRARFTAAY